MENDTLKMLAQIVLPSQILDYFMVVGIEQTAAEICISLDEKMNPELSTDAPFESKGFMEAVNVTDFPIRDYKVILRIRRRRWVDTRTGKSFSLPIDLDIVARGTRYSKEFGAFLKETYGDIPSALHTLEEFYHIDGHTFEKQYKEIPDIRKAYGLCHSLRMTFSKNTIKDAARLSMARWYNKAEEAGFHSFSVIAATFHEHYDEILNFYNNRSSNAMAESFNAKIKLFRANLRGVADKKFFLFRIANLYAYPH